MTDVHVAVPPKGERSIINRRGKQHQTNCDGWVSNKVPWPANAHHILPVTCFNPIALSDDAQIFYVMRCIWVSQWDINGGNKFPTPPTDPENNMVSLPLSSAYKKSYPTPGKPNAPFKRPVYPVNKCMHNSSLSEHHLYIREVRTHLQTFVFDKLQEDKAKHKGKGKSIKSEIEDAVKHFRGELVTRGSRTTKAGNQGTIQCWQNQKTDDEWGLPFSMASDDLTQAGT
jgi:hypothetical protein